MSKPIAHILIPAILLIAGCAQPMQIDQSHIGNVEAKLRIETPGLSEYVPIMGIKEVHVSLAKFPGCHTSSTSAKSQSPIGEATLTPKEHSQTVSIPAGVELAVYAESEETTATTNVRCGQAVRFFSESGKIYILRFKPHESLGFGSCEMQILAGNNGSISPVESAHYGVYTGDDLDLCK